MGKTATVELKGKNGIFYPDGKNLPFCKPLNQGKIGIRPHYPLLFLVFLGYIKKILSNLPKAYLGIGFAYIWIRPLASPENVFPPVQHVP
jgi:hypothetical protein